MPFPLPSPSLFRKVPTLAASFGSLLWQPTLAASFGGLLWQPSLAAYFGSLGDEKGEEITKNEFIHVGALYLNSPSQQS